jgi:hypothetical protein
MAINLNENWYQNAVELEGGSVLLYQRADSPSGRWQCRLLVPNNGGYVTKSTKKTDIDEAKKVALDLFNEIRFKIQHDMPVRERNFERTFGEWIEARSAFMSAERVQWHKDTGRRYFFRHFNQHDCQSALNFDPLSASNIDPSYGTEKVVQVVNRGDPRGFV